MSNAIHLIAKFTLSCEEEIIWLEHGHIIVNIISV